MTAENKNVLTLLAVSRTLVVLFGKPGNVAIVNEALVAPAGTVTVGGTAADLGTRLDRSTTRPPAGAGAGSVTVPVAEVPADTVLGLTVNVDRVGPGGGVPGGSTVRIADTVSPAPETKIVTTVCSETAEGIIRIPVNRLPAGITAPDDRNGRTVGLSLHTLTNLSNDAAEATVTLPLGVPASPPTTSSGTIVNDSGATSGNDDD